MSKKSRKQRKKQRTKAARAHATATPEQARLAPTTPTPEDTAEVEPVTARATDVRPEDVVGEVVEQVFHAIEDVLPEPHHEPAPDTEAVPATQVSPTAIDNRRKHPRVALTVEIDLASESHFFSGLSGDVSEGGVFVETYRDIPVGSEVALEFELPNGIVNAHGAVKWHRDKSDSSPPGVGVEFEELSDEGKAVILAFCSKRAPLYYEVAS